MFSVDDSYNVIVSDLFSEQGPSEFQLSALGGKQILLPNREQLYPAQEALAWHRNKLLDQ